MDSHHSLGLRLPGTEGDVMTVDAMTIFLFLGFPLFAEVIFAAYWQEVMGWHQADPFEKVLLTGIFLCVTFTVLILPAMAFVSLFANLFNALYY